MIHIINHNVTFSATLTKTRKDQDFNSLTRKCQCLAQVIFKVLVDMVLHIRVCIAPPIKWAVVLDVKCHNIKVVALSHLLEIVVVIHQAEVNTQCLNFVEVVARCLHLMDILLRNLEMVAHRLSGVTVQLVTHHFVQLLQSVVDLAIVIQALSLPDHVKHHTVAHHSLDHNNVDHHHSDVMHHVVDHHHLHSVIHVELHMAVIIEKRPDESYVNI